MNKEQLLKRKSEIGELLSDETRSIDNLDTIETELRDINEQLAAIEKREQLLNEARSINEGNAAGANKIETFNANLNLSNEKREIGTNTVEYRNAFMNYVLRGEAIPAELRANAVTKTSDIGSVIPQTVLDKIIEKIEAVGMILPLITRTAIKGGVTVPTSAVKPVATWVAESSGSDKQRKLQEALLSTIINYVVL